MRKRHRVLYALVSILVSTIAICASVIGLVQAGPQAAGVDLGPDRSQQAKPGENIKYDHVLTNTGSTTDTFSVDALSTQGWPMGLACETHPTATEALTLELGAQTSTALQVSLSVPLDASGVTEVTLITATSRLSPTVQDVVIDTTRVPATVYLPLLMRRWPPLPYQPTLHSISNPDGDGDYTVSWTEQPSRHADVYVLQEAADSAFTSDVREACRTASESCEVTGRSAGTYYYRVRGHNIWGDGPYSAVRSVTVSPPATPVIDPIANSDGDGAYAVAWDAAARANSYTLQEDTDPAFGSPTDVYHGAGTAWNATSKTAGTYHYRVQAHGPTGESDWSEVQAVTVLSPGTPTLHAIDNADEDGAYSVSWSAAERATSYELQEDTDSDFDSPQIAYQGSAASWDATGKAPDTYYYRVKALGPTGQSDWSNTRSVVVTPPPEEVLILSSNAFIPYEGSNSLYIVGEVVNNTGSNVEFVTISATLRGSAGDVVDSDYSYSMIDTLNHGMKSPFLVLFSDPPPWSSYELAVDWDTAGSGPHQLEVLNTNSYFDSYDEYHTVGEIKNQTGETRTFVKAFVTLYDGNGEVIGADYSYTNPDELDPGQTASFDTGVYFWKGKPDRSKVALHALQVLDD